MSDLQKYFPFPLNGGQRQTVNALVDFLYGNSDAVFILTGYAGTGKTTILKGVLDYMDKVEIPYKLWASTGRAAKVLGSITHREAQTIHSAIYMLDENDSKIDEDNKRLAFKLKHNYDDKDTVYFIDEASMIADKSETNPFLLFEDGRLLDHMFTYFQERKVAFIGDTAQLPP
nr:AAA family ATPase [Bacteroidota bacterium]